MAHGWEEQAPEGPISRRLRLINRPEVPSCAMCGADTPAGDSYVVSLRLGSVLEGESALLCESCGLRLSMQIYGRD